MPKNCEPTTPLPRSCPVCKRLASPTYARELWDEPHVFVVELTCLTTGCPGGTVKVTNETLMAAPHAARTPIFRIPLKDRLKEG